MILVCKNTFQEIKFYQPLLLPSARFNSILIAHKCLLVQTHIHGIMKKVKKIKGKYRKAFSLQNI